MDLWSSHYKKSDLTVVVQIVHGFTVMGKVYGLVI